MMHIAGQIASTFWWGVIAFACSKCLEQGLTNIGIAIANSTSAVIKAALQAKKEQP